MLDLIGPSLLGTISLFTFMYTSYFSLQVGFSFSADYIFQSVTAFYVDQFAKANTRQTFLKNQQSSNAKRGKGNDRNLTTGALERKGFCAIQKQGCMVERWSETSNIMDCLCEKRFAASDIYLQLVNLAR